MKLTEKDKKLLYVLSVLVIVAAFAFLLIKPQFEKHGKLGEQLTEAEEEKSAMELVTATIPASEKLIKDGGEEYSQAVEDFYPIMNSNQIEQNITSMVLAHQLTSLELSVSSQPEQTSLSPYFASVQGVMSGVEDTEEQKEGEEGSEEKSDESSSSMIYTSKIVVLVSGAEENMKALIDTISSDYRAIRITAFEMDRKTGISAENEVKSVSSMKLSLEFYMCEK